MKKMFLMAVAAMFLMVGCNEAEAGKAETQKPVAQAVSVAPAAVQATAAPAPAAPVAEAPKATIENIDWAKALEMQKAGGYLVDVRTPGEVAEGMAPGAVNIPLQEISHRLAEFPKDKDLLIYCRSGKRSMAASQFLIENGYEKVFNVVGGFLAFPQK